MSLEFLRNKRMCVLWVGFQPFLDVEVQKIKCSTCKNKSKKQTKPNQTKSSGPGDSKCPFHPLVGGLLTPWKGHFTIPKTSRIESPGVFFSLLSTLTRGPRAGGESRTIIAQWCLRMGCPTCFGGWWEYTYVEPIYRAIYGGQKNYLDVFLDFWRGHYIELLYDYMP